MTELRRKTDHVRCSFLDALLCDAGMEPLLLAGHISVLEGSRNEITRRFAVRGEDFRRTRWVLDGAGERRDAQ